MVTVQPCGGITARLDDQALQKGGTMKKVSARQGKKKLSVQLRSDKAFFDFDPFGGEIIVTIR